MPSAAAAGSVPLDPDYADTMTGKTMAVMTGGGPGGYVPDGDKTKAMKAVYEVIVGEGIGVGREGERVLPLGRDEAVRVQEIVDQWKHAMEVFGDICNNVFLEK
jgi:hypothetical protein